MKIAMSLLLGAACMSQAFAANDHLKLLYWQAPSILNPYLSGGIKDVESSSIILDPLAKFNQDGALVPALAESIPSESNGGFSADKKALTWKLKKGVKWSDGKPFTAHDVKFTADYCMHPQGGCAQANLFEQVKRVEVVDDHTVTVHFKQPVAYPYQAFVSSQSPILPKHQFANCLGERASQCTKENFGPVGTGPFMVTTFQPNDVSEYKANPLYREKGKPHFKTVTLKGGGSAMDSARAVFETGEYDYAWNLQLAPEVLQSLRAKGLGRVETAFGNLVERIVLNQTNPAATLGDARSTVAHPHPFLTDARVRKALSMAIDRKLLNEIGYGDAGKPTCDFIVMPKAYAGNTTDCLMQDIEGARKLLDEAGWKVGADGIRSKDGVRMSMLYQTSVNPVRQDFQALIKEWWQSIGVEVELKSINASVFFGGDPNSPDTYQKFYADAQMYANLPSGIDPQSYFASWVCGNEPSPKTQWQGSNMPRYCNASYDNMLKALDSISDVEERGKIIQKLDAMLTSEGRIELPLINRGRVSGVSNRIQDMRISAFDSDLWDIQNWKAK